MAHGSWFYGSDTALVKASPPLSNFGSEGAEQTSESEQWRIIVTSPGVFRRTWLSLMLFTRRVGGGLRFLQEMAYRCFAALFVSTAISDYSSFWTLILNVVFPLIKVGNCWKNNLNGRPSWNQSLLVSPSGTLQRGQFGHQRAATATPRLDMYRTPQQTAEVNAFDCLAWLPLWNLKIPSCVNFWHFRELREETLLPAATW